MPTGDLYTPAEIYKVIHAETVKNNSSATIAQEVVVTSIVLAESGGHSHIVNMNQGGSAPGSRDRGWYQWNDHFNPDITDAMAFDPVAATHAAYVKSNGWKNLDPYWTGDPGRSADKVQQTGYTLFQAGAIPLGEYVGDPSIIGDVTYAAGQVGGAVTGAVGAVGDAVSSITSWTAGLTSLLAHLLDPSWWKRVGIGALGVSLIIVAIVLVFQNSDTVKGVESAAITHA